jgi:hypothetical protein
MNSNTKGLLFIVLGVLSLLWFGYEAAGYVSHGGVPAGENSVISLGLTGLKLVMAISFFVSGINSLRKKD